MANSVKNPIGMVKEKNFFNVIGFKINAEKSATNYGIRTNIATLLIFYVSVNNMF